MVAVVQLVGVGLVVEGGNTSGFNAASSGDLVGRNLLDRSVHEGVMQRNGQDSVEDVRQTNVPDFVFASVVFNNQLSFTTNTADLNDEMI